MVLKRRKVRSALERKGFVKQNGGHKYFIYRTLDGIKTSVRTMISHGGGSADVGDDLLLLMAQQCRLQKIEFKDLIECPLSREDYERKLYEKGILKPKSGKSDSI